MKRILLLCSVLAFACIAQAQIVSVKFYGPGNAAGLPPYWPQIVQPGTNAPAGYVLMTSASLADCIATNQSAYNAWESNRLYIAQAKLDANLARIVFLFQQIPTARAQMTNIQTSTISSVAAASTAIKATANVVDGILEELQRLGPVLREIYKPDQDSTQ